MGGGSSKKYSYSDKWQREQAPQYYNELHGSGVQRFGPGQQDFTGQINARSQPYQYSQAGQAAMPQMYNNRSYTYDPAQAGQQFQQATYNPAAYNLNQQISAQKSAYAGPQRSSQLASEAKMRGDFANQMGGQLGQYQIDRQNAGIAAEESRLGRIGQGLGLETQMGGLRNQENQSYLNAIMQNYQNQLASGQLDEQSYIHQKQLLAELLGNKMGQSDIMYKPGFFG